MVKFIHPKNYKKYFMKKQSCKCKNASAFIKNKKVRYKHALGDYAGA